MNSLHFHDMNYWDLECSNDPPCKDGNALFTTNLGNFLVYDFWTPPGPPPPINFVHGSHMYHVDIIGHVAAAPGPLAFPSRSALPPSLS